MQVWYDLRVVVNSAHEAGRIPVQFVHTKLGLPTSTWTIADEKINPNVMVGLDEDG
jgi:hypothetical protein